MLFKTQINAFDVFLYVHLMYEKEFKRETRGPYSH